MVKVLSIGNSFSQDAQRYLHQIAANEGVELVCENLVIGGCWLAKHWENMQKNSADYDLECSGQSTGIRISILDALQKDDWDCVTIQQVSSEAFRKESYMPYAGELAACIRRYAPSARIYLHQTWAYEQNSDKLRGAGFEESRKMLEEIKDACNWAAQRIRADGIIPSGEAMMAALDAGVSKVHRDTYHAALGIGRYLLGCVWYMTLTGKELTGDVVPLDEKANARDIEIVRNAARTAVRLYNKHGEVS